MLFIFTLLVDFSAMAVTLWLGFYLLGRGYPSRITLRAVVVLLALSAFFLGAFNNLFHQIPGTAALRAVLVIIGLATWYSLTGLLLPEGAQKRLRWAGIVIYTLAAVTAVLLVSTTNAFVGEPGNLLYVGRMGVGLPYVLYGILQIAACGGILFNLLSGVRIGLSPQGRSFLLASIFPIAAAIYGILALALTPPLPRLVEDLLIFGGVFLLGISVARYQTMVERRISLQDFQISGLAILGLSALYAMLAWRLGLRPEAIALVMVLAILTHSLYDLVREYLERARVRNESAFRRRLRQLEGEGAGEDALQASLQDGLALLCQTLTASGGFIAVRRAADFKVVASLMSLPLGSRLKASDVACEDVSRPATPRLQAVSWMAPAFGAEAQVAVIGVGSPRSRLDYSPNDLDLLAEVADRVGVILFLSRAGVPGSGTLPPAVAGARAGSDELRTSTEELMAAVASSPDPELLGQVEEALRHLSDYIALGQSPLAGRLGGGVDSHVASGKKLQEVLLAGIEALRPAGARPGEPLPRVWFNYAVLYDAYVEGVPNREIMARLYISEGTFNRTRRNALRGLTRLLQEREQVTPPPL
jgi:hypothetical protein